MRKQFEANFSSNDEGEDLFREKGKPTKVTTATTQEKSNISKTSNNELEEQRLLFDNSMRFQNHQEGFGPPGNDSASISGRSQFSSISGSRRPVTPTEDVRNIIAQIKDPKDVIGAVEGYKMRSENLSKDHFMNKENAKIKRYKNCLYFGQVINEKRHGEGVMVYLDSRIYEGEWENDVKHGKGLEINPNGNRFVGYYMNGKPEGVGVFTWKNGENYEGEWRNGMKHGSGMWRGTKGESYVGEWKYGKTDGHGVHIWKNGDRYEGEFKNSLKHGHGTERFISGDYFVGNYVNGKPDGYGEYYWANGCQYKGFFMNGLRYGKGIWRKGPGNADKYEGEWVNDKKCGHGIYTWASGNIYKGNYFDDLRHGYGEMIWTDGSLYKGQWERGIQHGEGELSVPGKSVKKGLFQNNIFVGESHDREDDVRVSMDISSEGMKPRRLTPLSRPSNEESYKRAIKLNDLSYDSRQRSPPNHDNSFQSDALHRNLERRTPHQLDPISIRGRTTKGASSRLNSSFEKANRVVFPALNYQSPDSKVPPPNGGWLTSKEIAKWSVVSEKLNVDPKKFQNLGDEKVVQKIRELIHPKIWKYWPKVSSLKGKSDILTQQTTGTALHFYNLAH